MPTHRTRADAKVGDTRADLARRDSGHVPGVHIGKAASSPMSISRRDAQPDNPQRPEEPYRSTNIPIAGEPRGAIQDSRRR